MERVQRHRILDYMTGQEVYPTPRLTPENIRSTIPPSKEGNMSLEDKIEALGYLGDITIRRVPTMESKPEPYDMMSGWQLEILTGIKPRKFEDSRLCRVVDMAMEAYASQVEEVLAPF